jgi:hypothetical protein
MKAHLTDKQLIEYEFKLICETSLTKAANHLETCKLCREHLEELRRKFASLDLLREDIKVAEDLISSVVEQADKPALTQMVSFTKLKWIAATAAVIVAGVLLLFTPSVLNRRPSYQNASIEKIVPKAEVVDSSGARTPALGLAQPAEQVMSEQPPFAPASAIELVTLPRRENVQLTIYNSADLTLVREKRNITLKKGWNWLQFMWANTLIDPTSLSLEPLKDADKVEIQQLVFPPRLRELGRWLIRSEVTGQVPFEITYFTSGLSWRAFYMGTLSQDEKKMRLEGYVRVGNNSGEDYENAQTRLIVGQVHLLDQIAELARRQYSYGSPIQVVRQRGQMGGFGGALSDKEGLILHYYKARDISGPIDELMRKEIKKEGLSEYFLYTIEGTETIPDKWAKRLLSLEAGDIPVKSLYKYDEERWGRETITFVAFANDKDHKLGETPIPNGTVKIYTLADEQGHLSYVGATDIKYIPVGEKIELNLGPARLVRLEPLLMDFKTENHVYDKNNDVAGWDEVRTWKIEVTNTRTVPVKFEITRGFGTAYWTMQFDQQGVSYIKHDATHARFTLTLEPRSKRSFEYIVRTAHGTREELVAKEYGVKTQ